MKPFCDPPPGPSERRSTFLTPASSNVTEDFRGVARLDEGWNAGLDVASEFDRESDSSSLPSFFPPCHTSDAKHALCGQQEH
eukprot:1590091-Prymnesium_polylepis.1